MTKYDLDLLLAYDDGPAAAVPGAALDSHASTDVGIERLPDHFSALNDDIDDLALQRWCIVVPEGDRGDRLRDIVAPLVRRRSEEQGAPVEVYRVPARMTRGEAQRWLGALQAGFVRTREAPRYFFLVGDLDEVPLAVQQVIALDDGCAGRVAFDRDDDLAHYVSRVMREEIAELRPAITTYVAGKDLASEHARARLQAPLLEAIRRGFELGAVPAAYVRELSAPPVEDELARSFLLTVSHGYGGDRLRGFDSPEHRRREQGSLVLPNHGRLTAEEFAVRPFARDGFWFMFACYGAGTPNESVYELWLRELRNGTFAHHAEAALRGLPPAGERPFVAALPRVALAHEAGPVACFGHVDIAWQYSYSGADPRVTRRPAPFVSLVEDACQGHRAGALARNLARAAADAALRLTAEVERARRDPTPDEQRRDRICHLWMLHHDLAAFILLGDPAVRLCVPLARTTVAAAAPPELDPHLVALARTIGADRLEEAMAHVLVDETAPAVARRLGITVEDLRALEAAYREGGRRHVGLVRST